MDQLLGHSITYRIAVGPRQNRKVFNLQTLPAYDEPFDDPVGKVAGFSLLAGVAAKAQEYKNQERLCRYISRPTVSEKRLSLTPNGNFRYQLKSPYRDGSTHVIFEPLDFIARLAALVPKPRVNLTRFHDVFAPNSKHRALVTPAKCGRGNKLEATEDGQEPTRGRTPSIDDLGAAREARIRHLHRNLPSLRWCRQDHRLHRGSGGDREDSHPPRQDTGLSRSLTVAALPDTATGRFVRLIHRQTRNQQHGLRHQWTRQGRGWPDGWKRPEKRVGLSTILRFGRIRFQPDTGLLASPTWRIRLCGATKLLIDMSHTPKGLHYTGVAVSAWTAVILGGG